MDPECTLDTGSFECSLHQCFFKNEDECNSDEACKYDTCFPYDSPGYSSCCQPVKNDFQCTDVLPDICETVFDTICILNQAETGCINSCYHQIYEDGSMRQQGESGCEGFCKYDYAKGECGLSPCFSREQDKCNMGGICEWTETCPISGFSNNGCCVPFPCSDIVDPSICAAHPACILVNEVCVTDRCSLLSPSDCMVSNICQLVNEVVSNDDEANSRVLKCKFSDCLSFLPSPHPSVSHPLPPCSSGDNQCYSEYSDECPAPYKTAIGDWDNYGCCLSAIPQSCADVATEECALYPDVCLYANDLCVNACEYYTEWSSTAYVDGIAPSVTTCTWKECQSRTAITSNTPYPCGPLTTTGPPCLYDPEVQKCETACTFADWYEADSDSRTCVLKCCADRTANLNAAHPCGPAKGTTECVYNPQAQATGANECVGVDLSATCSEITRQNECSDSDTVCYWDGTGCVAMCAEDNHHTGVSADGVCELKDCVDRTVNASASLPCGVVGCYQQMEGGTAINTCGSDCPPAHTIPDTASGLCALKECAERVYNASAFYPCGTMDCFLQPDKSTCLEDCGPYSHYEEGYGEEEYGCCRPKSCSRRAPLPSSTSESSSESGRCSIEEDPYPCFVEDESCTTACSVHHQADQQTNVCVLQTCYSRTPVDFETDNGPCGPSCFLQPDGRTCSRDCSHSHYESGTDGVCRLKVCTDRAPLPLEGGPCGDDDCYLDILADRGGGDGKCVEMCSWNQQPMESTKICGLLPCESRAPLSSESWPCSDKDGDGGRCYLENGRCVVECSYHHQPDEHGKCIPLVCAERIPLSFLNEPPCGDGCLLDTLTEGGGEVEKCVAECFGERGPDGHGKCVSQLCEEIQEKADCNLVADCRWTGSATQTSGTCRSFDCSFLCLQYEQANECNSESRAEHGKGCEWRNNACAPKNIPSCPASESNSTNVSCREGCYVEERKCVACCSKDYSVTTQYHNHCLPRGTVVIEDPSDSSALKTATTSGGGDLNILIIAISLHAESDISVTSGNFRLMGKDVSQTTLTVDKGPITFNTPSNKQHTIESITLAHSTPTLAVLIVSGAADGLGLFSLIRVSMRYSYILPVTLGVAPITVQNVRVLFDSFNVVRGMTNTRHTHAYANPTDVCVWTIKTRPAIELTSAAAVFRNVLFDSTDAGALMAQDATIEFDDVRFVNNKISGDNKYADLRHNAYFKNVDLTLIDITSDILTDGGSTHNMFFTTDPTETIPTTITFNTTKEVSLLYAPSATKFEIISDSGGNNLGQFTGTFVGCTYTVKVLLDHIPLDDLGNLPLTVVSSTVATIPLANPNPLAAVGKYAFQFFYTVGSHTENTSIYDVYTVDPVSPEQSSNNMVVIIIVVVVVGVVVLLAATGLIVFILFKAKAGPFKDMRQFGGKEYGQEMSTQNGSRVLQEWSEGGGGQEVKKAHVAKPAEPEADATVSAEKSTATHVADAAVSAKRPTAPKTDTMVSAAEPTTPKADAAAATPDKDEYRDKDEDEDEDDRL